MYIFKKIHVYIYIFIYGIYIYIYIYAAMHEPHETNAHASVYIYSNIFFGNEYSILTSVPPHLNTICVDSFISTWHTSHLL